MYPDTFLPTLDHMGFDDAGTPPGDEYQVIGDVGTPVDEFGVDG